MTFPLQTMAKLYSRSAAGTASLLPALSPFLSVIAPQDVSPSASSRLFDCIRFEKKKKFVACAAIPTREIIIYAKHFQSFQFTKISFCGT